ncbi:MAG: serine/threonine protein phosphatase [Ruminococcaceae bacterium]|nr:serine/threonine protein phosphatase [Oscillospiraceae bacterium]
MAVYTIGDLHLSLLVNKPMDKFGHRWTGYTEKIEKRWRALVEDGDTVVVPGDISWAMTLDEAAEDFRFIDSLPGRKILGKGNHDYWWTTVTKMKKFLSDIGISSIDFLQNNAFRVGDGEKQMIICGTRGWFIDEKLQATPNPTDYEKLVSREVIRLTNSLSEGVKLRREPDGEESAPIKVFLHFPPVFGDFIVPELIDTMRSFGVSECFFGHIHGKYSHPQTTVYDGIKFTMISADFIDFYPQKVFR